MGGVVAVSRERKILPDKDEGAQPKVLAATILRCATLIISGIVVVPPKRVLIQLSTGFWVKAQKVCAVCMRLGVLTLTVGVQSKDVFLQEEA